MKTAKTTAVLIKSPCSTICCNDSQTFSGYMKYFRWTEHWGFFSNHGRNNQWLENTYLLYRGVFSKASRLTLSVLKSLWTILCHLRGDIELTGQGILTFLSDYFDDSVRFAIILSGDKTWTQKILKDITVIWGFVSSCTCVFYNYKTTWNFGKESEFGKSRSQLFWASTKLQQSNHMPSLDFLSQ